MRVTLIAGIALVVVGIARTARAQCGETESSCWSCHETRAARSVTGDGSPWHRDHAFGDVCGRCHGGDPLAGDEAAAHVGLLDPLADPNATCAGCHPDDAAARSVRYRAAVTVGAPPPAPPPPATVAARHRGNDLGFAIAIGALGLVGAIAVIAGERRRRGAGPARPHLLAFLARPAWSPYLAGALLGVVVTISLAIFGRRLSGSGAYASLSGYVGARVAPHAPYWTSVVRTGMTWDVWLLIGTFAGAFASAAASRRLRIRTMPDARWIEAFGPSVIRRWALVFVGTALLSIAAGIAGGCTASLVLSGGAVLAPGAFVFMAAMFAGGIPVAAMVERLSRRHR